MLRNICTTFMPLRKATRTVNAQEFNELDLIQNSNCNLAHTSPAAHSICIDYLTRGNILHMILI